MEAYGAQLAVTAPDGEILAQLLAGLPIGWTPLDDLGPDEVAWRFAVMLEPNGGYRVRDGNGVETPVADLDLALGLLHLQMRRFVGYHAKDLVFIHAGVVAHRDRAIVVPGHSFSGKSTLIAELVRAGAIYYSDEYAVLDADGRVHPYREPLVMRDMAARRRTALTAEELGGRAGDVPVGIGIVALATYVADAQWAPRELSAGQGLLALLEHAIPVQDRPEQTLAFVRRSLGDAVVLAGERGEAAQTARMLLETASERF